MLFRSSGASTSGVPSDTIAPPHVIVIVLVGPNCCAKVKTIVAGDDSTVAPAAGTELTSVLSAAIAVGVQNEPTNATINPTINPTARPMRFRWTVPLVKGVRNQARAERVDDGKVFMEVQQS